jgi:hypothetical protein
MPRRPPARREKKSEEKKGKLIVYGVAGALAIALIAAFLAPDHQGAGNAQQSSQSPAVNGQPTTNAWDAKQRLLNQESSGNWALFSHHRNRVTEIVAEALGGSGGAAAEDTAHSASQSSLVVFGAGNLNDLDTAFLTLGEAQLRHLSLVDIDDRAIAAARERIVHSSQQLGVSLAPPADLSGGALETAGSEGWASKFKRKPPQDRFGAVLARVQSGFPVGDAPDRDFLQTFLAAPATVLDAGGFDVALSVGLLSQLMDALTDVLDDRADPQVSRFLSFIGSLMLVLTFLLAAITPIFSPQSYLRMLVAIRELHVRQLISALRPGGTGILVVDFVSSDTVPNLRLIPEDDTGGIGVVAKLCEGEGNYFHGTQRRAVQDMLSSQAFSPLVEDVRFIDPWKWTLSETKSYLVYAVQFRRRL